MKSRNPSNKICDVFLLGLGTSTKYRTPAIEKNTMHAKFQDCMCGANVSMRGVGSSPVIWQTIPIGKIERNVIIASQPLYLRMFCSKDFVG